MTELRLGDDASGDAATKWRRRPTEPPEPSGWVTGDAAWQATCVSCQAKSLPTAEQITATSKVCFQPTQHFESVLRSFVFCLTLARYFLGRCN